VLYKLTSFSAYLDERSVREKRWYTPLIEFYGLKPELTDTALLNESDFTPPFIKRIVERIMDYEKGRLNISLSDLEVLLGEEELDLTPMLLIAPYVLIKNQQTLLINRRLIEQAVAWKKKKDVNIPLYAVIMLDKDLLYRTFIDEICKTIKSMSETSDLKGFFVWVTDFKEYEEEMSDLRNLLYLYDSLKKMEKEVFNLFGGFLSLALCQRGSLNGTVTGLGFGESRDPFAEPGMVLPRYYMPILHRMLNTSTAEIMASINPIFQCTCSNCSSNSIINMKAQALTTHFIEMRIDEMRFLSARNSQQIKSYLDTSFNNLNTTLSGKNFDSKYDHLDRWSNLF